MQSDKDPPADKQNEAEVTVRMTPPQAELLMRLLSEGKLEHLGIQEASVALTGERQVHSRWTKAEGLRRIKSNGATKSDLP